MKHLCYYLITGTLICYVIANGSIPEHIEDEWDDSNLYDDYDEDQKDNFNTSLEQDYDNETVGHQNDATDPPDLLTPSFELNNTSSTPKAGLEGSLETTHSTLVPSVPNSEESTDDQVMGAGFGGSANAKRKEGKVVQSGKLEGLPIPSNCSEYKVSVLKSSCLGFFLNLNIFFIHSDAATTTSCTARGSNPEMLCRG